MEFFFLGENIQDLVCVRAGVCCTDSCSDLVALVKKKKEPWTLSLRRILGLWINEVWFTIPLPCLALP